MKSNIEVYNTAKNKAQQKQHHMTELHTVWEEKRPGLTKCWQILNRVHIHEKVTYIHILEVKRVYIIILSRNNIQHTHTRGGMMGLFGLAYIIYVLHTYIHICYINEL